MKNILNRIIAEFNKIYYGTKRVGDSLKLNGKREHELDVYNASKLGYKTESELSVKNSKYSEKTTKIQAYGYDGNPLVNSDGEYVFKTENQLRVSNAITLNDKYENELDVHSAIGFIINNKFYSADLFFDDVSLYRVKDSKKLNGKYEYELSVNHAKTSDDATLLGGKKEKDLNVNEAIYATYLKTDDGKALKENELRVYSSQYLIYGTSAYNLIDIKNFIINSNDLYEKTIKYSETSGALVENDKTYTYSDIINEIKNNTAVDKAEKLYTSDGYKSGDDIKSWIIDSSDFANKVGTLNANSANIATKIGNSTENYNIDELKTLIKTTVVDKSIDTTTINGKTIDDIEKQIRYHVFEDSSNTDYGLTTDEINGFFNNEKVINSIKSIKVDNAINSDTLSNKTLDEIKSEIQNSYVEVSKYILSDPNNTNSIKKSYNDILKEISNIYEKIVDSADSDYDTLSKIENFIKNIYTEIDKTNNNLSNETSRAQTAENNIQSELDNTQKGAGLNDDGSYSANSEANYISDATSLTDADNKLDSAIKNNEDKINQEISDRQSADNVLQNNIDNLQSELDKTQSGAGLATDGSYQANSDANYISDATSLADADNKLDTIIKNIENSLISYINTNDTNIKNIQSELDNTQKGAGLNDDGSYSANEDANYISDANSLADADNKLDSAIKNNEDKINQEISDRQSADNAIQSELDKTQTGAGLNDDGSYSANSDTNFIYNATSLMDADIKLDNAIKNNAISISNETSRAQTAENNIQSELDKTQSGAGLNDDGSYSANEDANYISEATSLTDADNKLDTAIKNNEDKINQEISDRQSADSAIQSELDNTQTGAGLNDDGSYSANENANYISDATSLADADNKLDSAIKNNEDKISQEIQDRQNADSAIQSELDNTQTGAGLNDDGSYSANSDANYISEATSLADADNKLDNAIKNNEDKINQEISDRENAINELNAIKLDNTFEITTYVKINSSDLDSSTLSTNTFYFINGDSEATITLPYAPENFKPIKIHGYAGDFTANKLTIEAGSGGILSSSDTIMGSDSLTIDYNNFSLELIYIDGDWRIISKI
jgi:hypothetical protein